MDNCSCPHFLLFSEAQTDDTGHPRWRFALENVDSQQRLAASAEEEGAGAERAELLAAVRGLEALEQPSRVTLVTNSRYVARGIARDLDQWRSSGWTWERFGKQVPVRDEDLWRRVDRAMDFHAVTCRRWAFPAAGCAHEGIGAGRDRPEDLSPAAGAERMACVDRPAAAGSSAVVIVPRRTTRPRRWATSEIVRRTMIYLASLSDLVVATRLRVWPTAAALAAIAWLS